MASRSVILFLAANPVGTIPRALDQECAAIERELKLTPGRDDFELRSKWAVTVDDLMRHLLDLQPTIVHFSGHGHATGLVLVGDDGQPQPVTPAALTAMIRTTAATVRLAVLNACYSDAQAEALRDAVGCAVGMKGAISDDAARAFAIGFYRALGHRRSVRNAYEQAEATLAGKGLSAQAEPRCLVRPGVEIDVPWSGERASHAPPAAVGALPAGADPGLAGEMIAAIGPASPIGPVSPPTGPASPPTGTARPAGGRAESGGPAGVRYDLFLAHPSANKPSARALHELLQPDVRAFLDERSLSPGARWDQEIPAAQRASRATVVLISSHADAAWYLGAEIVTAIALHRAAPAAHALVPVILEPGAALPYGLSHVQAIDAAAVGGLAGVAARLREVVAGLRGQAVPLPVAPDVTSADAGRCDHVRLHARLSRLPDVVFEQIVFYVRIDRSLIAPTSAPLATRVLDVAQLAAVDQDLCRRIAAELDRRAPWTR
jgi:hypothetical protein